MTFDGPEEKVCMTFDYPEEKSLLKHFGKEENVCEHHFLFFPKDKSNIWIYILFVLFRCFNKPFSKQTLVFTCLQDKFCENPVGKVEIAIDELFPLFPLCFLPFWSTFCHF